MKVNKILAAVGLLAMVSFQKLKAGDERAYVNGVVFDKQTNKPLPDVYVYIIKGEEEAITDQQGKFSFTTWHRSNMVLNLKRPEHNEVQVKLSDPKKDMVIRL